MRDCTADCMYCDGKDCPYAKSVAPAHYKIARFALIATIIIAVIIAGAVTIANHKANQNYAAVKIQP